MEEFIKNIGNFYFHPVPEEWNYLIENVENNYKYYIKEMPIGTYGTWTTAKSNMYHAPFFTYECAPVRGIAFLQMMGELLNELKENNTTYDEVHIYVVDVPQGLKIGVVGINKT